MKKDGVGGARTLTGLLFEGRTDFVTWLDDIEGYEVELTDIGHNVLYENKLVAKTFKKYDLYKFLETLGVSWKDHLSKRLLPDNVIYVINNNTIFIIEIKYQEVSGSVDEKLQTCDFKKKQYQKLFKKLGYKVEYVYILSPWFQKSEYSDVLEYVQSVGCHYFFDLVPFENLGLPVPTNSITS